MITELSDLYQKVLLSKEIEIARPPKLKICVQGGIGTTTENEFLMQYCRLEATDFGEVRFC